MAVRWLVLLLVAASVAGCSFSQIRDRTGAPGDAASDLVSSKTYDNLVVEIDHPPGHAPDAGALADLKTAITGVVGKRSVTFLPLEASVPAEPSRKYSYAEIEALERQHRDRHSAGEDAVLYVIYLAGGAEGDTENARTLGAVYRPTSIVIFKGNVQSGANQGGLLDTRPELRFIERAVLIHEFGHTAGLVNLGAPMVRPHEDPNSRGHSTNKASVMYYAVDSSADLFRIFTRGSDIPWQFDEDDKADLRALREG